MSGRMVRVQLPSDDRRLADELYRVIGAELEERKESSRHRRVGSEVAPHRVQCDAGQGYASRAATRCSPA